MIITVEPDVLDDNKNVVTPGYKKRFLDPLSAHYDDLNYSDLGKLAFEELWRRRNEPTTDTQKRFVVLGVHDAVADFDNVDYSETLLESERLYIITPNLHTILSSANSIFALVNRIVEGKFTRIFTRLHEDIENNPWLEPENAKVLQDVFAALPSKEREEMRFRLKSERESPSVNEQFRICGIKASSAFSSYRLIHTEKMSVCAIHSFQMPNAPFFPAVVFRPSPEPVPRQFRQNIKFKGQSAVVEGQSKSIDFWTTFESVCHTFDEVTWRDINLADKLLLSSVLAEGEIVQAARPVLRRWKNDPDIPTMPRPPRRVT